MRVYIYKKHLSYVISVPLVYKLRFNILRLIPIPVPVNSEHFLYIDFKDDVLCLDQAKQFYFTLKEDELAECRRAEPGHHVCTHPRTLLSVPATDSCAVTLLQKRDSVPSVCETRLVRLSSAVWTQLTNNSWIYYAPHRDVMTIVCRYSNSVDIYLEGVGKLQIFPGCKGYSPNAILYGSSVAGNTSVQLPRDLLLQIDFKHACCEDLGVTLNFSQMPAEMTYRKAVFHLDDLRLTSTRVSDLLDRISEQDWKNHLVTHHNTHFVLLYVLVSVSEIYWAIRLYFYVHRRVNG